MYADDTQVYLSFSPRDSVEQDNAWHRLEACLTSISGWMEQNLLKLNGETTKFTTKQYTHLHDVSVTLGDAVITPSQSVRNLGVVFDHIMSMEKHACSVSRSCYAHLRNISQIRRCLNKDATRSLMHIVLSRLDYCNVLLCGASILRPRSCSWSKTQLHGSSRGPVDGNTSHQCSVICTGCQLNAGYRVQSHHAYIPRVARPITIIHRGLDQSI